MQPTCNRSQNINDCSVAHVVIWFVSSDILKGTANPPTKSSGFRGFDSSRLLIQRGGLLMSVEFYRESPGKFDSRTLNRKTLNRWTGRSLLKWLSDRPMSNTWKRRRAKQQEFGAEVHGQTCAQRLYIGYEICLCYIYCGCLAAGYSY